MFAAIIRQTHRSDRAMSKVRAAERLRRHFGQEPSGGTLAELDEGTT